MQHDKHTGEPLAVCDNCGELFNPRSAKLGADNCTTCDRRMGNSW